MFIINYDKATVSNLSALSRLCQKDTTQFLSTIFAEWWLGHICFVIAFVFLESSLSSLFTSHKCLLLWRLKHQNTAWIAVNMPCLFVNFSKTWHWVSENLLYNILRVYSDPHADVNYRYLSANQKRIGSGKKKILLFRSLQIWKTITTFVNSDGFITVSTTCLEKRSYKREAST